MLINQTPACCTMSVYDHRDMDTLTADTNNYWVREPLRPEDIGTFTANHPDDDFYQSPVQDEAWLRVTRHDEHTKLESYDTWRFIPPIMDVIFHYASDLQPSLDRIIKGFNHAVRNRQNVRIVHHSPAFGRFDSNPSAIELFRVLAFASKHIRGHNAEYLLPDHLAGSKSIRVMSRSIWTSDEWRNGKAYGKYFKLFPDFFGGKSESLIRDIITNDKKFARHRSAACVTFERLQLDKRLRRIANRIMHQKQQHANI